MVIESLEQLNDVVKRTLMDEFTQVEISDSSGFTLRHESARVFISCVKPEGQFGVVHIEAPLLFDVPESPELFEFIALHADDYVFGHLSASRSGDHSLVIVFSHSLLGDYLDDDELIRAVTAVLGVGNELDDTLQRQFGGFRFHEDA